MVLPAAADVIPRRRHLSTAALPSLAKTRAIIMLQFNARQAYAELNIASYPNRTYLVTQVHKRRWLSNVTVLRIPLKRDLLMFVNNTEDNSV